MKNIRQYVRVLWMEYAAYLFVAALISLFFELDVCEEGALYSYPQRAYVWQTIEVMLSLFCIPVSLKIIPFFLRRFEKKGISMNRSCHHILALIRYVLLAAPTYLGIWIYYATLNNIGAFCALSCVTASLFCLPQEERVRNELFLTNLEK